MRTIRIGLALAFVATGAALQAQTLGLPTLNPTPGPFAASGITVNGTLGAIGAGTASGSGGSLSAGFAYRSPGTVVSIDAPPGPDTPLVTRLDGNYPNPFNPTTAVRWQLAVGGDVRITVYDLLGRRVAVLADATFPAGAHATQFNAAALASGVYVVRMEAGSQTFTRRMTLLK